MKADTKTSMLELPSFKSLDDHNNNAHSNSNNDLKTITYSFIGAKVLINSNFLIFYIIYSSIKNGPT